MSGGSCASARCILGLALVPQSLLQSMTDHLAVQGAWGMAIATCPGLDPTPHARLWPSG